MNMFINIVSTIDDMKPTKLPSPKSHQTRARIVSAALGLFESKGYAEATMRDIAKEAGVSLGLTYRYFSRKEELVLALYDQLADQSLERVQNLPSGTISERFPKAVSLSMEILSGHRATLGALFSAGLSIDSSLAVLGESTVDIREKMLSMYRLVLTGSSDAPKEKQVEQLTTVMYAGHLLTVLFWTQDRSEGQVHAKRLVEFYGKGIKWGRPLLRLPVVTKLLAELTDITEPVFGATLKKV
jgi:AcrR family transcriptional regulator